jgi:hypothetical protein
VRRFIFAIVLTVIAAAPALADVRIMSSAGGPVVGYLEFFSKVRKSGERVVIDGPCLSACTTCSAPFRGTGSASPPALCSGSTHPS